jgi:DNA-binding NarL/FixJ family response regulator
VSSNAAGNRANTQVGAKDRVGKPTVLIAADLQLMADALGTALDRGAGLMVVSTIGTVKGAIDEAAKLRPDVIVMDYDLPDGTGADAATAILSRNGTAAVVMMAIEDSNEVLRSSLEAGVAGFVLKSAPLAELVKVIRLAAEGELAIPRPVLAKVIQLQRDKARQRSDRDLALKELTDRELEVLRWISQGLDNRAIANNLGVSVNTIRGHVQKVLEKLGVHSKLGAMAQCVELGIS